MVSNKGLIWVYMYIYVWVFNFILYSKFVAYVNGKNDVNNKTICCNI